MLTSDIRPGFLPDILIVGLQETCPLGFFRVLKGHSPELISNLKAAFKRALNKIGIPTQTEFKCFAERAMVGCLVLGFCVKDVAHRLHKI